MSNRPLSSEIRDGLAACANLRAVSGPLSSERIDHELDHIETLLHHLLKIITEKVDVDTPN